MHLSCYRTIGGQEIFASYTNFVTRVVTLSDSADAIITPSNLPLPLNPGTAIKLKEQGEQAKQEELEQHMEGFLQSWVEKTLSAFEQKEEIDLEEVLAQIKQLESHVGKAFIKRTLKETHGNRRETAKRLQITMRKLRYLLNEKNESL